MITTIPKIDFNEETVEYKNLRFTVQKDRGDSQRSRRRNEDQLLSEEGPVRSLGNTSTGGFGGETLTTHTRRDPRYTLWNVDYTSKDGCTQMKLTPERIDEQIIDVLVPLPILEETVAVIKQAPHEHAQTTQKRA